ncbi:hypothetical protein SAMN06295879_0257 [Agreia bicolorata]|uniref:Uncharacterized protein n=1 Tax=Agreia bicolorata TaxID=110935 RepID=A0A1T4WVL2_9MICO|nr:hypothetical protein TZ00_13435 [Agreia bicolorata]SKA80898.1 hypothetical protein SAMN06295879_0257 [Agreia bicolorata]
MIAHSTTEPSQETISLVRLSPTEWRVSDPRVSVHDAASLLGFIEARGGVFEVTLLKSGVASRTVHSLDDALSLFASNHDSGRVSPSVRGSSRTATQ